MLGGENSSRFNAASSGPIRLSAVNGYEGRVNDVIYCPPLQRPSPSDDGGSDGDISAVVYFGGDIQDFPENMQVHRDSKAYIKYNLENTALMLRNNFPKSHIVIIKAVRMEFKTFSCYDNFVRGCNAGIPDHTPMNYALQHLEKLLQNIPTRIKAIPESELLAQIQQSASNASNINASDMSQEMDIDILQVQETVTVDTNEAMAYSNKEDASNTIPTIPIPTDLTPDLLQADMQPTLNNATVTTTATTTRPTSSLSSSASESGEVTTTDPLWWRDNLNLDKANLILIAFSKGSVVLNQFIYEFHYIKTLTPDDSSMMRLVSRIREMYWLDGGHSAPKNTWITSRSLLETLTRLGINLHVHVTPYQVLDDRRPWIRRDEKAFTDLLKRLGAPLTRILHFDHGVTNLFTHFEVLEVFKQPRTNNVESLNNVTTSSTSAPTSSQPQQSTTASSPSTSTSDGGGASTSSIEQMSPTKNTDADK